MVRCRYLRIPHRQMAAQFPRQLNPSRNNSCDVVPVLVRQTHDGLAIWTCRTDLTSYTPFQASALSVFVLVSQVVPTQNGTYLTICVQILLGLRACRPNLAASQCRYTVCHWPPHDGSSSRSEACPNKAIGHLQDILRFQGTEWQA